jgi:hypothetical protein
MNAVEVQRLFQAKVCIFLGEKFRFELTVLKQGFEYIRQYVYHVKVYT